jgi:hypothetical protein
MSNDLRDEKEDKLPARDWIVLPLLSLLTIALLSMSMELLARMLFKTTTTLLASCIMMSDPAVGARGIPNSECWEKTADSEAIQYKFNSCGHRAGVECGPKPPGVYRIVMTGASVPLGDHVRREDSFAALLPLELSRETGRNVELYNEGIGWGFSRSASLNFDAVLAAKPDMILWPLSPFDIAESEHAVPKVDSVGQQRSLSFAAKVRLRIIGDFGSKPISVAVTDLFGRTRTAFMFRYLLNGSQTQFLKSFLMGRDVDAGFLRSELSVEWKRYLRFFDRNAAEMEGKAKAAGVPFVAVMLPIRAQAEMISMRAWPTGYDPYKLDSELRSIITSHGGIYVEILPYFRTIPNLEPYYLRVDEHPNARGHLVLSALLARALTSGVVPALKASSRPVAELSRGN